MYDSVSARILEGLTKERSVTPVLNRWFRHKIAVLSQLLHFAIETASWGNELLT